MPKCDEPLLLDYARNFLGYGALNSPLWLIGPEAGGGKTIADVHRRASIWAERGRKEIEDLHGYHKALKINWDDSIQRTWGALIRVTLALHGQDGVKTEDVMEFQRNELGRSDGQNALLDLSQLSSPSSSAWIFHECGIDWLKTRKDYEEYMLPQRCLSFREKLRDFKPRLVLFYGLGHRHWWERIAQNRLVEASEVPRLSWARDEGSLFAMMPHQNGVRLKGKGANNRYFADVGAALREELR